MRQFYQPARFPNAVVFDPFMGSGTTVGEALKLGCRAVGRDINAVAYFLVRNALQVHPREEVIRTFDDLGKRVQSEIARFYECQRTGGTVLYFFWVKNLPCSHCSDEVDLFPRYIFAQHAYPRRHPESQAVCPRCGEINEILYDAEVATCRACHHSFSLRQGPARGTKATCSACSNIFSIAATARNLGHPLQHRMYAKLDTRKKLMD